MGEFASKGVAGTALGFGIGGTALALLNNNGCGGGLLGGLLGGNRNGNCCEPLETREASCLRQQVAALQAEKYADNVGIATFKAALELSNKNDDLIRANQKEAFQELVTTRERLATTDANIQCITAKLGETVARVNVLENKTCENSSSIQALASDTRQAIALEAERRQAADDSIRCWVKATYVPGTLSLSPDSMCPKPVTCCDVLQYYNAGGKPPVPSPCGCSCGTAAVTTASSK